jgi:hypothetical protein
MLERSLKTIIICLIYLLSDRYVCAMNDSKEGDSLAVPSVGTERSLLAFPDQRQKNWDQAYYHLIQSQLPKFIAKLTYNQSENILFRTKDKQFTNFIKGLEVYQKLACSSPLEISEELIESTSAILSGLMYIAEDIHDLIERKIHFKNLIPASFQQGEVITIDVLDPEKYSRPQVLRDALIQTDSMLLERVHKFLNQYTPLLNMLLEDQLKHAVFLSERRKELILPIIFEHFESIDKTRQIFSTMREDIQNLIDNYKKIMKVRCERLRILAKQEEAKEEIAEKQRTLEKQRKLESIPVLKHFTKHRGPSMVSPRTAQQEALLKRQEQNKISRKKLSRVRSSPNFDDKKSN